MWFSSLLVAAALLQGPLLGAFCSPAQEFLKQSVEQESPRARLILDRDSDTLIGNGVNFSGTPAVFWHGMGDTAHGSIDVVRMALQKEFPEIPVYSVQVGNNAFEDELSGYLGSVNAQVEQVCQEILNNKLIRERGYFNCMGFSQGAQFMRALIQRCPLRENNIRVRNYVSMGGQHQGVFGVPLCKAGQMCDYIRYVLTHAAYEETVQQNVVQAQYWHDPTRESVYREKSHFLADINNEIQINETYKRNLLQLDNMVLVQFLNDSMVVPPESSTFGFFDSNDHHKVISFSKTRLFRKDLIGLRTLLQTYKLQFIKIPGNHLEFTLEWFMENIARYFNN